MKIAVMAIAVIMFSGCKEELKGPDPRGDNITEVYLSDGTRCAVYVGSRKGGMSCDWAAK